jgi:hypothetical protein
MEPFQEVLDQLQEQVQILQQQNTVLQLQVAQQAHVAHVIVPSPELLDPDNIIDYYKLRAGLKIHETATHALPKEYDLD